MPCYQVCALGADSFLYQSTLVTHSTATKLCDVVTKDLLRSILLRVQFYTPSLLSHSQHQAHVQGRVAQLRQQLSTRYKAILTPLYLLTKDLPKTDRNLYLKCFQPSYSLARLTADERARESICQVYSDAVKDALKMKFTTVSDAEAWISAGELPRLLMFHEQCEDAIALLKCDVTEFEAVLNSGTGALHACESFASNMLVLCLANMHKYTWM